MRRWLCSLAVLAFFSAWGARATPQARADAITATARDPNHVAAEVMDARYQRVDDEVDAAGKATAAGGATAGRPSDVRPPPPTRNAPPRREASATTTSFGSLVWIVLALVVILAVAALVIAPGGSIDVAATGADDAPTPATAAATVAVRGPRAALRSTLR